LLLHGGLSITHTPVLLSDAERSKPVLVMLVVAPDFNLIFDVRAAVPEVAFLVELGDVVLKPSASSAAKGTH
jgi:hypothetical protein